jgi:hypothetical protein
MRRRSYFLGVVQGKEYIPDKEGGTMEEEEVD